MCASFGEQKLIFVQYWGWKKFDPKKLEINLGCTELVVGDDTITTEVAISSITYDNIEYVVEYDGSENCSIEVIWGSEPEL